MEERAVAIYFLFSNTFKVKYLFILLIFIFTQNICNAKEISYLSKKEKKVLFNTWFKDIYLENLPELVKKDLSSIEVLTFKNFLFDSRCVLLNQIDQTRRGEQEDYFKIRNAFSSLQVSVNLACMDGDSSDKYSSNIFIFTLLQNLIHEKLIDYWLKNHSHERIRIANNYAVSREFFGLISDDNTKSIDKNIQKIIKDFWHRALIKYIKRETVKISSGLDDFFKKVLINDLSKIKTMSDPVAKYGLVQNLNGQMESFWARYLLIKSVTNSIYATYFIISNDVFGLAFLELLKDKAQELPKDSVRLMVDGRNDLIFSSGTRKYLNDLSNSGVVVKIFNSLFSSFGGGFFAGNHDKILIVDEVNAIIGGRNIEDVYFLEEAERIGNKNNKHSYVFQDNDVAVKFLEPNLSLQLSFNSEFYSRKGHNLIPDTELDYKEISQKMKNALLAIEDGMYHLIRSDQTLSSHPEIASYYNLYGISQFVMFPDSRPILIRVLDKSSLFGETDNIYDFLLDKIDATDSGEEIIIKNPYIDFSSKMFEALKRASIRGVEIVIFTNGPKSTDNKFVSAYFLDSFQYIIDNLLGVKVFGTFNNFVIHQKTIIFSAKETFISTYNLDSLSRNYNSEIGFYIEDEFFSKNVKNDILREIDEQCKNYQILKEESDQDSDGEKNINGLRLLIYKMFRKYF